MQTCAHCGGSIDPDRDYQRIGAWRKKRHGNNSANFVRLIEPVPDTWACRHCVEYVLPRGLSPTQMELT